MTDVGTYVPFDGSTAGEKENSAATTIQARYRGYTCRQNSMKEESAALLVQKQWKGMKVRVQLGKERAAAQDVQRLWRGHLSRLASGEATRPSEGMIDWLFRTLTNGEKNKLELTKRTTPRQAKAALKIQSTYRGHMSRTTPRQAKAALKIQSTYRGHMSRVINGEVSRQSETAIDWLAASLGFGRNRSTLTKRPTKLSNKAATRIQAIYRGVKCRRTLSG